MDDRRAGRRRRHLTVPGRGHGAVEPARRAALPRPRLVLRHRLPLGPLGPRHRPRGRRVAVVGTGASAIQFVPRIAPLVDHTVRVCQRSAPYVLPKPDRPYTRLEKYIYRHFPATLVASRTRQYMYCEARVLPLTKGIGVSAVERAWERYLNSSVREELRRMLRPDYPIGCKRVLISNDWYPALNRPNVEVVPAGLTEVRPDGAVAADGTTVRRRHHHLRDRLRHERFPRSGRRHGPRRTDLHETWQDVVVRRPSKVLRRPDFRICSCCTAPTPISGTTRSST